MKSLIYTIPFWSLENLSEALFKNFGAKRLKMGFSKIDFDPTPDPLGGPPLPLYKIVLEKPRSLQIYTTPTRPVAIPSDLMATPLGGPIVPAYASATDPWLKIEKRRR